LRLSRRTLAALPAAVRPPAYDPASLRTGIVHLGVGAFQRAHQAAYTQPLLAGSPEWGTLGASLRRADTRDALAPQDFLYTLAQRDGAQRDGDGERLEVIGSISKILVAPEAPAVFVARMADPGVRIVTLTVAEKAYFRNAATGELDEADPAIRADLADPARPATALGVGKPDGRGGRGDAGAVAQRVTLILFLGGFNNINSN
jgi:fructuronate reductase